jgi:hypothetical protein
LLIGWKARETDRHGQRAKGATPSLEAIESSEKSLVHHGTLMENKNPRKTLQWRLSSAKWDNQACVEIIPILRSSGVSHN